MRNKKRLALVALTTMIFLTSITPARKIKADENLDYSTALKDSIIFYDANKCGKDAGVNNYFTWRSACHIDDGKDKGLDLSGGYHDAGDHVKFGLPQG